MTHNYRVCFDYDAESPRDAVIFLQGVMHDPIAQDFPFSWLVIDRATGEEYRIRCSFNELEKEASKTVKEFLRRRGSDSGQAPRSSSQKP